MTTTYDSSGMLDLLVRAVQARLNTLQSQPTAYRPSDAPRAGSGYVIVGLTRRVLGNARAGGPLTPSGWRTWVRAVGADDNDAMRLLDVACGGLEDETVTVEGVTSTPLRFETQDDVREDENDLGIYSGLRSFTYGF